MSTITVSHTISMGHRLPSYDGICSSPHGHNVKVEVEVDPSGQFLDFKEVQLYLQAYLNQLDHAMVLYVGDPILEQFRAWGFRVWTTTEEPTTERIAKGVMDYMRISYTVLRVTVYETDKYSATVR